MSEKTELYVVLKGELDEAVLYGMKLEDQSQLVAWYVKDGTTLLQLEGPGADAWRLETENNGLQLYSDYHGVDDLGGWLARLVLLAGGDVSALDPNRRFGRWRAPAAQPVALDDDLSDTDVSQCYDVALIAFHPYGWGSYSYGGGQHLFEVFNFKSERVTSFTKAET